MPMARVRCLIGLAAATRSDPQLFDPRSDLTDAVSHLKRLPGIGEWTAQYIAMRALGESDAFLAGDVGLQSKFSVHGRRPTADQLLSRAESWRPWRAYATLHLWMSEAPSPHALLKKESRHALTA